MSVIILTISIAGRETPPKARPAMRKSRKPLPLREWQKAQRIRAERRKRLPRWMVAMGIGSAVLMATIALPPRPLFVWNASASTPIGLYYIGSRAALKRGDPVAVWLPELMRRFAAERRYLPRNIPALKRVAAINGDTVCAAGKHVYVEGKLTAERQSVDTKGRAMPLWEGCKTLGQGELFLLNSDAKNSFDGRYIGITKASDVIGKVTFLCAG
ncbi:MAG: S26 family signal peptidase [Sphingopyxis sp.]|nr:MAG: S26 family signal peptidase [Sphingopyxis sp.]